MRSGDLCDKIKKNSFLGGLMYIGIDIGGTKCAVVKGRKRENGEIEIIEKIRFETLAFRETFEKIMTSVEALMPCEKIGISCGGPLDERKGIILSPPNLPGWDEVHITEELEKRFGVPARLCNDANACALAEWKFGAGKGCENMVLVTLGTGIGGGIIINGSVFFGAHGSAGEIGHMILNRNEQELHTSGVRGCAEQYCSATGIVRLANRYLENNDTPSVLRNIHPLTCKAVFDAGNKGDPAAQAILEAFYELLGEFLANVCNVLDPELVLLGGGVSKAGSTLLEGVRPYFRQKVFHAIKDVDFSIAALGNDAGVYGAFKLALQSFCK